MLRRDKILTDVENGDFGQLLLWACGQALCAPHHAGWDLRTNCTSYYVPM